MLTIFRQETGPELIRKNIQCQRFVTNEPTQHNTTQHNTTQHSWSEDLLYGYNCTYPELVARNGITNPLLALSNNFDRHGLKPQQKQNYLFTTVKMSDAVVAVCLGVKSWKSILNTLYTKHVNCCRSTHCLPPGNSGLHATWTQDSINY
jgi:hypothetical protein